ncbi:MAG: histidine phosphatase family protein [Acidobacteria bacterium]|nr:histidine phosphatase family protein [Acidobacteriota bacterium]
MHNSVDQPLQVWLIRHGETEWSRSGQHSGRTDLPLTAAGEQEALVVGRMLNARPFDHVFCSPLRRASRTCELAGYLTAAIIDPDMQEWDYGDCTGFTQEQLRERYRDWTIWEGPVPNGESIAEIAARARRVVDRLRKCTGTVAVFAHGHFLRVLTTQWLGLPPESARHFALETSAVCILGEDGGEPAIRVWNWKDHLPTPRH